MTAERLCVIPTEIRSRGEFLAEIAGTTPGRSARGGNDKSMASPGWYHRPSALDPSRAIVFSPQFDPLVSEISIERRTSMKADYATSDLISKVNSDWINAVLVNQVRDRTDDRDDEVGGDITLPSDSGEQIIPMWPRPAAEPRALEAPVTTAEP